MIRSKIKKGDMIKVLSGKERGKTGKVTEIDFKKERVYISGVNIVKKAVKQKNKQEKGGIIEIEAPLHISKVQLLSKGMTSRIGFVFENGKKVRLARKTGEHL